MTVALEAVDVLRVAPACQALGLTRAPSDSMRGTRCP